MKLAYHAFADAFPLVEGAEFDDLTEDICQNGVREPIILLDGKILDGRNRYRALVRLHEEGRKRGPGWGVFEGQPILKEDLTPDETLWPFRKYQAFEHGDPLAFVVSKNLHRRHLTASQRAMVAASLGRLGWGGDRRKPSIEGLSAESRAEKLGVSVSSVERAQAVLDHGEPELQQAVRQGHASVNAAAAIASMPRDDQREVLRRVADDPAGRKAIADVAKEMRRERQLQRHQERQQQLERIAEKNPELPTGRRYSLVLIDVPRHHNVYSDLTGSEKAPENHYLTMGFRELLDFPINRFAADDAIIAYWSTAASLLDDLDILAEWGFVAVRERDGAGLLRRDPDSGEPYAPSGRGRYGSHMIWRKVRPGQQSGTGRWVRDEHEILILARRGNVPAPIPGTQPRSVFEAEVGQHSEKPGEAVRAFLDRQWPHLSKIEVFARGSAPPGWTFWGNQVDAETGEIVEIESSGGEGAPIIEAAREDDAVGSGTPPSSPLDPPSPEAQGATHDVATTIAEVRIQPVSTSGAGQPAPAFPRDDLEIPGFLRRQA